MKAQADDTRARVVFLIRVPADRTADFLGAYDKIRYEVAGGVDGHLIDQVCQAERDPEQWMITSEWTSIEAFESWERSPGHRSLVAPMRDCLTEATSLRFVVRAQTSRGSSPARTETRRPPGIPARNSGGQVTADG